MVRSHEGPEFHTPGVEGEDTQILTKQSRKMAFAKCLMAQLMVPDPITVGCRRRRRALFSMAFWRIAAPLFAVGIFVGISLSHLFSQQIPPTYLYEVEGSGTQTFIPPKKESSAYHPPTLEYESLGPEFTQRPWWEEMDTERTLYVAPYTGIANTLQAIGSALTIAHEKKINIRFVFHREWFGPATWDDLFSFPVVNFTRTFPDGETNIQATTSCTHGSPPFTWDTADVRWVDNPEGAGQIGCVTTCCWREPPYPQHILWFLKILRPALPLQEKIDQFKRKHGWDHYQWVGVHLRRTDNIETMKKLIGYMTIPELREAIDLSSAESMLPTQHYIQLMQHLQKSWPVHLLGHYQVVKPIRFFLATDRDEVKVIVMREFKKGDVVSFDKQMDSSDLRNDVWGMQLGIIDIFLLASCRVVIGTPFSTFSEVATYIGGALQLEPNFSYNLTTA